MVDESPNSQTLKGFFSSSKKKPFPIDLDRLCGDCFIFRYMTRCNKAGSLVGNVKGGKNPVKSAFPGNGFLFALAVLGSAGVLIWVESYRKRSQEWRRSTP